MRFLKYLLSFIIPKRMGEHRDMNLFITVLLFLLCSVMIAGVSNIRLSSILKNSYLDECYAYEETFGYKLSENKELPKFTIDEETHEVVGSVENQIIDLKYTKQGALDINLKLVYEFDKTSKDDLEFDLNSYLKENPYVYNNSKQRYELKSQDILVVYTKSIFYYIFNHGYMTTFLSSDDHNNLKIDNYFYLNVESWANTNEWTPYKVKRNSDGTIDKDVNGKFKYLDKNNNIVDDPNNYIYTNNINQLFTYKTSQNVGIFSYLELNYLNIDYINPTNPLFNFTDILVECCKESVGTYSFILSFFYIVILPLLWVLVIWLLMRKNAELTRFREYYSVCAVSFILPSIIGAIISLFIPYSIISKFIMIAQAVFYFIVISIINSTKNKNNQNTSSKSKNDKSKVIEDVEYEVETKKITSTDYYESKERASIVE